MTISTITSPHGVHWQYEHCVDEPQETLDMAPSIAATIAIDEAQKTGKNYVVASSAQPPTIHALASDHPAIADLGLTIMYEFTPRGERVGQPNPFKELMENGVWELRMTDTAGGWVTEGAYESVVAAGKRILKLENDPGSALFFKFHVETKWGSDEEAFSYLQFAGKNASRLYGVKRVKRVTRVTH